VPLHTTVPHDGLPADPAGAKEQVPAGVEPTAVHTWQAPPHDVAQQTPPTAYPFAHAFAAVDGWPFFSPQAPAPLHVEVLAQLACKSVPARAGPQVPLVPPETCSDAAHA
jgi:hypothetical protein